MLRQFSVAAVGSALASTLWAGSVYASQFVVYLPTLQPAQIPQVKTIAPDAFYTQLDSGQRVLQVGRYNNLPLAQKRVQQFRQAGFAAEIRSVPPKVASVPPLPPPVQSYPPAPSALPPALPGVPSAVDTSAPTPIEVTRPSSAPQPISSLPPAPPVAPVPTPPPEPLPQEEVRYFVIIPTTSQSVMQRVRAIAPNAKFKSSNRGPYIEVQGYPDRGSAETMSATLRGQGFDARVAYF